MKAMAYCDIKAKDIRKQADSLIARLEESEKVTCPMSSSGAVCAQHPLVIETQKATLALLTPVYDKVTNGGLSYVKIFGIHFQGNAATLFVKGFREICIVSIGIYFILRSKGIHLSDIFQAISKWL